MKIKELYGYRRKSGGITVSTDKPGCEYFVLYRLMADEGNMISKDGEIIGEVADCESVDGYVEVAQEEAK